MTRKRILAAFDFDHTIVEENSDIVARKLIHVDLIPEHVRKLYQSKGWTEYMSEIFKLLHKHKISRDDICKAMHEMIPTHKMPELLKWLKSEDHETIIISDSNSVFINEWLQHKNLHECVKKVFTNPASFTETGLLTIQPYHDQDWCQLSTKNLCKGHILDSYIKEKLEEGEKFDFVMYVGDGQNDHCPALRLSENDFVFPRSGFPLETKINDSTQEKRVVARVAPWISATEIMRVIQTSC